MRFSGVTAAVAVLLLACSNEAGGAEFDTGVSFVEDSDLGVRKGQESGISGIGYTQGAET